MATWASTPKPKGLACPVTLGYPDPGTYEDFVQREKENAARKKADEDASSCLLLGRDLSPTRIKNTKWCICGLCRAFRTVHENVCCREVLEAEIGHETSLKQRLVVEELKKKLKDCKHCITEHPSFEKVVLDVEVLSVHIQHRRFGEKRRRIREDQNMVFRYYAYRSFVFWAYGSMGMRKRFELPACVRAAIMAEFPLDGDKPSGPKGKKGVKRETLECDNEEWRNKSEY